MRNRTFIPQADTPFGKEAAGTLEMTLRLLSIIRLIHPTVLLPATTALGTIIRLAGRRGFLPGQCCDAESVTGRCQEKISVI